MGRIAARALAFAIVLAVALGLLRLSARIGHFGNREESGVIVQSQQRCWAHRNRSEVRGSRPVLNASDPPALFLERAKNYLASLPEIATRDECVARYGSELVDRFRGASEVICDGASRVTCFLHQDSSTERLCYVSSGATLDLERILRNKQGELSTDNWRGAVEARCELTRPDALADREFGNGGQRLFQHAFRSRGADALACDGTFAHDVLFVDRYDEKNLFHAHEDMLQTFTAFAVLGMRTADALVVRVDNLREGPFRLFWDHVVSELNGPPSAEDLRSRDAPFDSAELAPFVRAVLAGRPPAEPLNATQKQLSAGRACITGRAVFAVHAGVSPLSRGIGMRTQCSCGDAALILGFRDFMLKRLSLPDNDALMAEKVRAAKPLSIVYASRKGFLREITNEGELLAAITQRLCVKTCLAEIATINFQNETFVDQIRAARFADVLLGMHGASLTSLIYLPPDGAVLEFTHRTRYDNHHFQNMAAYIGVEHQFLPGDDHLPQKSIAKAARVVEQVVLQIIAERGEAASLYA
jgi:hypothetical protein